jgi:hypothetical protein
MKDKIQTNPKLKERIEALKNGAFHFRGAGDALNLPIEEKRADRGHNLANLASIQKAEDRGVNFTERADGNGNVRIREPNGELEKWEAICEADSREIRELQRKQNEQYEFAASYSRPLNLAPKYLLKLPAGIELIFDNRAVTKRKGENDPEAMTRLAREIGDANDLLKKTQKTPKTPDEAKTDARAHVSELRRKGAPDLAELLSARNGAKPRWPSYFVEFTPRVDVMPVLAWLHGDAMIAALDREIDDAAALNGGGLSAKDRSAKLADIENTIFDLESDYEALWYSLARTGVYVPRRLKVTDARPLLGLSRDMPKIEIKN